MKVRKMAIAVLVCSLLFGIPVIAKGAIDNDGQNEAGSSFAKLDFYNNILNVYMSVIGADDLYESAIQSSGLHSGKDEKWHRIDLQAGQKYYLNLKDTERQEGFVELYYMKNDGTEYKYITNRENDSVKDEWYFCFKAKDTGNYYVRIIQRNSTERGTVW